MVIVHYVFSGVRPTNSLHIGNYIGAIKTWIKIQNDHQCIFSIVDLHALTTHATQNEFLNDSIYTTVCSYLACGIDNKKNIIFLQGMVPEHLELAWFLSCITPIGWLERMTQFKQKSEKKKATAGLLSYPILMAADILLYDTEKVPVGDDQKQHVELARDIANCANNILGKDFFTPPTPVIEKKNRGSRIMSLKDGSSKMSKSCHSESEVIFLTDTEDQIIKKIKKAKTDTMSFPTSITECENRNEILNLINIYHHMSDISHDKIFDKYKGEGFANFKNDLIKVLIEKIIPIGQKIKDLKQNKGYIKKILKKGAKKAQAIANNKITKLKDIIGTHEFEKYTK